MNEQEVKVFIDLLSKYFERTTSSKVAVGVPYLKGEDNVLLEYTGIIGISGANRGCIYFTASKPMLVSFIKSMLKMDNPDEAMIKDIIGEIANTIAGNARNAFGDNFMISVPIVVEGQPKDISLPLKIPTFIIPMDWEDTKSFLVVGIE